MNFLLNILYKIFGFKKIDERIEERIYQIVGMEPITTIKSSVKDIYQYNVKGNIFKIKKLISDEWIVEHPDGQWIDKDCFKWSAAQYRKKWCLHLTFNGAKKTLYGYLSTYYGAIKADIVEI